MKKTRRAANTKSRSFKSRRKDNSWAGAGGLGGQTLAGVFDGANYGSNNLSMPYEIGANNAYNPVTLNRILLTYAYMTYGPVQTVIEQPVKDGLRGGVQFLSDELDAEELELLHKYFDEFVIPPMEAGIKWAELYGGAGMIINTDQDPSTPLDEESIDLDSPLAFIDADRWELILQTMDIERAECPYVYYGQQIHKTRVIKINGREAPSFLRSRLQGWGMSVLERLIRPINSFIKNEDVIYELLDEAKTDIWRVEGFNAQILNAAAQGQTSRRLQIATQLKNYHNAIVMDKEDEYDQKQISFSNLSDILEQNRIGLAASARMPMAKLFGLSAAGFNSGEDDIENYNAMVESEVRQKIKFIIMKILPLVCRQLFGFTPEVKVEFQPLRVLSAEQEENVKNAKFTRLSALYTQGIYNPVEYCDELKKAGIMTVETEVSKGAAEPEPKGGMMDDEEGTVSDKADDGGPKGGKKPKAGKEKEGK